MRPKLLLDGVKTLFVLDCCSPADQCCLTAHEIVLGHMVLLVMLAHAVQLQTAVNCRQQNVEH